MAKKNEANIIIMILLVIIGAVLAVRVLAMFRFAILGLFLLIAVGVGTYFLIKWLRHLWKRYKENQSMEGEILQKQRHCRQQIERLELEVQDIQLNILDLEAQLSPSFDIPNATRVETQRLITAFENEQQLRRTKISFYRTCLHKLETLLTHYRLTKKLQIQQQKLKALQERNQHEIADLEAFKSDLEYDKHYLETIDTLSLRMLDSASVDDAEYLQLELIEMTKELDDL